MQVRPDWRRVLARAWSVRMFALAILVQAIDVGLPWFRARLPVSDEWFGLLTIFFCAAGIYARTIQQKSITPCQ